MVFNNSPLPSLHRVINIPLRSRALTQPVINVSSAAKLFLGKLILQGMETSWAVDVCAQDTALSEESPADAPSMGEQSLHGQGIINSRNGLGGKGA